MKNKIKICKCGHGKQEHKKTWCTTQCKKCNCTDFMNKNLPDKFSIIILVSGIVGISIIVAPIIFSFIFLSQFSEEELNTPFELSAGEYLIGFLTLMSLIILLLSMMMFDITILDYFKERKRKSYPVED